MTLDDKNKFLKTLSEDAFLSLGSKYIAYMREVDSSSGPQIMVYTAAGQPLTLAHDRDTALAAIAGQDMKPVPLH
jgi:hypothetical protein